MHLLWFYRTPVGSSWHFCGTYEGCSVKLIWFYRTPLGTSRHFYYFIYIYLFIYLYLIGLLGCIPRETCPLLLTHPVLQEQWAAIERRPGTNSSSNAIALVKCNGRSACFGCGRKPECPEETHADTGRTWKLHSGRPTLGIEPKTFLLRGNSANHWATVHWWHSKLTLFKFYEWITSIIWLIKLIAIVP